MKVELRNTGLRLTPESGEEVDEIASFRKRTSFLTPGYRFDTRFLLGRWDGRTYLVEREKGRGKRALSAWTVPVGLLAAALEAFEGVEVEDLRRPVGEVRGLAFDSSAKIELRDYQREAVDAFVESTGLTAGKGLLQLPTRSGKTVIASEVIRRLGVRTLFVVSSNLLLRQTAALFSRLICEQTPSGAPLVAVYGAGSTETAWITVASVQSLCAHSKRPEVRALLATVDLVIFDECHHLTGDFWREVVTGSDARYKLGLSATIEIDADASSVWIEAATGPVLYALTPSDLIADGWLCRPLISFEVAPEPPGGVDGSLPWSTQYRVGIVENAARNARIAALALEAVLRRERVLVTLRHVAHCATLRAELEGVGLTVAEITGSTPAKKREKLSEAFRTGELDVLIGTVFGEGVDLPWLDTVIVGDGGASPVLTLQRLRNLTPYDPLTGRARVSPMEVPVVVRVHDFVDLATKSLASHSRARLRTYREHEAFDVRWSK